MASVEASVKKAREGATSCCLTTTSSSSLEEDITEVTKMMGNNNNNVDQKWNECFPKRSAVNLQFSNIKYTVMELSRQSILPRQKEILHGVSGEFRSGQLAAIMGPSGAGKSTLLNVLAGYAVRCASGSVMVNGRERTSRSMDDFFSLSCYIQQQDAHRGVLTVWEAMTIVSHLKLGTNVPLERKQQLIAELLDMLGLSGCRDTASKKLSGGQKKRLSVALELISNPPVMFLDEPTTGLDSSSCTQCVTLLQMLARQGRTIICTIHQPSALIFSKFDKLYALAEGRCIYRGGTTTLVPYLGSLGLSCPSYHNPADFLLEVASGEYDTDVMALADAVEHQHDIDVMKVDLHGKDNGTVQLDTLKLNDSAATEKKLLENGHILKDANYFLTAEAVSNKPTPAPVWLQYLLLLQRSLRITKRSYCTVLIRLISHIVVAYLFSTTYYNVGPSATTVFASYIYIYGSVLLLSYTGKMTTTLSFPLEFNVLSREHFNRWYSLGPYFLSVLTVEIPLQTIFSLSYLLVSYWTTGQPMEASRMIPFCVIITCASLTGMGIGYLVGIVTSVRIAVFAAPVITCFFSTFGFNLFYRDTPHWMRFFFHISYFRAAFHGAVYSVYGNNRSMLYCGEENLYCHYKYPTKFLVEMDVGEVNVYGNLALVIGFGVVSYILALIAIWVRLNKR